MVFRKTCIAGVAALLALSGCNDAGDGMDGTEAQVDSMVDRCISQAARYASLPEPGMISVQDQIQTAGGPVLTLDADGTPLRCSLRNDGSASVVIALDERRNL